MPLNTRKRAEATRKAAEASNAAMADNESAELNPPSASKRKKIVLAKIEKTVKQSKSPAVKPKAVARKLSAEQKTGKRVAAHFVED